MPHLHRKCEASVAKGQGLIDPLISQGRTMLSFSIIAGILSSLTLFSSLVMTNALYPEWQAPGLEQLVESRDTRSSR